MVHAIELGDSKVSYRNRWVRTDLYRAQREAGRRLASTEFAGAPAPGGEGLARNVANTNIVWHAGRLLALDEGNVPVSMDPATLETEGKLTFGGAYSGPFSAHPKIDPKTGELVTFGYMAGGIGSPEMSYTVIDASGAVTCREKFAAPFASMVHDFVITDEHVIFPICPATLRPERMRRGGPLFAWEPEAGTHIGVMNRKGGVATMRWFQADACYLYHVMNAFTTNANGFVKVVVDVMKYERVPLFPNADGSKHDDGLHEAKLVRWTLDLSGDTDAATESQLTDLGGEFPRLDERFAGANYRHGFYCANRRPTEKGAGYDTIAHIDFRTGASTGWEPGAGKSVVEPIFVPRNADAAEGDGWLVSLVYDRARNLSDFVVLDALEVSRGPLARVELPARVPFGFHGNWRGPS
jgi:carotenoid cleavage dioxygenase